MAITVTTVTNDAVAAAKDVPDLVAKLKIVDPDLASQIEGKSLILSKSPIGTLVITGLTYVSAKWGFGWDETTCNFLAGAGLLVGAYIMRYITTSPISGIFTKTPVVTAPPSPVDSLVKP